MSDQRRIDCVAEGLRILSKYEDHVAAEHDIIYAGPAVSIEVSAADAAELERLSWFIDDESETWAVFV